MKILLVYPGMVEGFGSYNRKRDWFNHGVGIISALLKREGHEIAYLDCRKMMDWDDVSAAINKTEFSIALISIATVDLEAAVQIARLVKAKGSQLKVMVGGPHPTLMTEETARIEEFDFIFTHEAEQSLPDLLADFPNIPRITRGMMPADLDTLPFVDRSLAPEGETPWFAGLERPYFSITASRGCLYKCTFCQPAEREVFGNKVRKRSVDNILDELEVLEKDYGLQSFMIHDDCFTQYYSWVEEFCRKKLERGLTQTFVCQSRADIICNRPDLMQKLVDAGLRWVLIGFESGSDRILQFLQKQTTVDQTTNAARICKELTIRIFGNYMFGVPTESEDEMRATVRMIRQIRPDLYGPNIFTPAPGSDLYTYCQENGLSLVDSSSLYKRTLLSGEKIKGVNYALINRLIFESMHGPVVGWFMLQRARFRERFQITRRLRGVRTDISKLFSRPQ